MKASCFEFTLRSMHDKLGEIDCHRSGRKMHVDETNTAARAGAAVHMYYMLISST